MITTNKSNSERIQFQIETTKLIKYAIAQNLAVTGATKFVRSKIVLAELPESYPDVLIPFAVSSMEELCNTSVTRLWWYNKEIWNNKYKHFKFSTELIGNQIIFFLTRKIRKR